MLLDEFSENQMLSFIKCERYVNDGSPSKNHSTTSERTSPRFGDEFFYVYEVVFERKTNIFSVNSTDNNSTMIIHPDFVDDTVFTDTGMKIVRRIKVAPTSSGRTVLSLEDGSNTFYKLAYPKCLGRLTRHMGKDKILSAAEVTDRLIKAVNLGLMNKRFAMFKERSGKVAIVDTDKETYEWGLIFRETKAYPYVEGDEYFMPFFSLFSSEHSKDNKVTNPQHTPFIVQLFERQSKSAEDFLLEDVIFPLFDCYFEALLYAGIELEAHAQNMLISFDSNFEVKRIICRDLESAGRDVTLMERLGLDYDLSNSYKCNYLDEDNRDDKYPKWYCTHSFMFDYKLGEYIVTPLLTCYLQYFSELSIETITERIKKHNQIYIDRLPDFFPEEWCYYSNENFEVTGNKKKYIWVENPKYR